MDLSWETLGLVLFRGLGAHFPYFLLTYVIEMLTLQAVLFPIETLLCSLEGWGGDSGTFAILSSARVPKDLEIEVLVPFIEWCALGR